MRETEAIKGIKREAKRRERAEATLSEARRELRRYCHEAQQAGVPITRIAREAGLSRQGVYDLLAERTSQ